MTSRFTVLSSLLVAALFAPRGIAQESEIEDFTMEVETLDGKTLTQEELRGKVALVDIWGTWCPPCRRMVPVLSKLYRKYKDKGFVIVGLAYERGSEAQKLEKLRKFVKKNDIPYPVALGPADVTAQIPKFRAYPTLLYFKKGLVCDEIEVGVSDADDLEAWIVAALEGKAPPKKPEPKLQLEIALEGGKTLSIGDGKSYSLIVLTHPKLPVSEGLLRELRRKEQGSRVRCAVLTRKDLGAVAGASAIDAAKLLPLNMGKAFPAYALLSPDGSVLYRAAGSGPKVEKDLLDAFAKAAAGKLKAKAQPVKKKAGEVKILPGGKIEIKKHLKRVPSGLPLPPKGKEAPKGPTSRPKK